MATGLSLPNLTSQNSGFATTPARTAYGSVPSAVGMPASTYSQTAGVLPSLPQLTQTAGGAVGAELGGQLSPGTVSFLQDKAAQFGVGMGIPGVGAGSFGGNNLLRSLGLTSEQVSQQGIQDYRGLLGSLSQTQLSPELQNEINTQNSLYASAPDPRQAALQQIKDLKDLYQWEQDPSGGTAPVVKTTHTPYNPGLGTNEAFAV